MDQGKSVGETFFEGVPEVGEGGAHGKKLSRMKTEYNPTTESVRFCRLVAPRRLPYHALVPRLHRSGSAAALRRGPNPMMG